jgi:signal transduction histidine kinase
VARIEVTAQLRGGMVELAICDNGVGFDSQYQDKLFRVFERLHYPSEFEGTGVGLAIVKRVVERHGGSVTAHSESGQGAEIRVTLPVWASVGAKEDVT